MNEVCHIGLDAKTMGKNGATPLGDLATIICSYDETKGSFIPRHNGEFDPLYSLYSGYQSNSLAKWFTTVGGRLRLASLLDWLYEGRFEILHSSCYDL